MGKHNVTIFRPYPFKVGQKIYIEDGPRHGDWEVMDKKRRVQEIKVKKDSPTIRICRHQNRH